jgi:hypothetical protein
MDAVLASHADRDSSTLTTSLDISTSPTLLLFTTHLPGLFNNHVGSHVDAFCRC